jgi:hypothetical protein
MRGRISRKRHGFDIRLCCEASSSQGISMRYFLDTESNGFGGEMISLALVPEDSSMAAFYEAVTCEAPTAWVIEHVQPVLDIRPLGRAEVANRFADYLQNDEMPVLVADWPEDIAHAARLLIIGPGRMKPVRNIRFELVDPDVIGPYLPSAVRHNAKSDAQALRATVLAYEQRMHADWQLLGAVPVGASRSPRDGG